MARNPWFRQGLSARNAWILPLEIGRRRSILVPMQAAPDRREASDPGEFGQVLQFRRRPDPSPYPILTAEPSASPLRPENGVDNDFARYEQEHEEPIDYRQRK